MVTCTAGWSYVLRVTYKASLFGQVCKASVLHFLHFILRYTLLPLHSTLLSSSPPLCLLLFVSSHLISSYLILSHLISSHLSSPHLISSHPFSYFCPDLHFRTSFTTRSPLTYFTLSFLSLQLPLSHLLLSITSSTPSSLSPLYPTL